MNINELKNNLIQTISNLMIERNKIQIEPIQVFDERLSYKEQHRLISERIDAFQTILKLIEK